MVPVGEAGEGTRAIRSIVVLRALMLGDMLCAVPALRALREGMPAARITLVGLPWAAELAARLPHVDEFIALPGVAGLPETGGDHGALPGFLARMRARRFDLALQMHGSGQVTNPIVRAFAAPRTLGFHASAAPAFGEAGQCWLPWPGHGHEIERLLRLVDALGVPRRGTELEFPLTDRDRAAAAALLPVQRDRRPYVCVHPGAQLASRRWPAERFAAVADLLADSGRTVLLTGSRAERSLVGSVAATARNRLVDLAGRTDLWMLGALVESAEHVLCNDTGISHIAAALRRPSTVVSSGGDVARWAPLDRSRHRVLWRPTPCRPCSHPSCPIGHPCALGITVSQVRDALRLSPSPSPAAARVAAASGPPRGRTPGALDHV